MLKLELERKIKTWKELQIYIQQLEGEADAIKAAITAEMDAQQTETITTDMFTVRYTTYQSSRVDTSALKKELPDIAARYSKTTEARRRKAKEAAYDGI